MNPKLIALGILNTFVLAGVLAYFLPSVQEASSPMASSQPAALPLGKGQGDWFVTASLPISLPEARYLAVAEDGYYVANSRCIHHYDAQGKLVEEIANTTPENITAIAYLQGQLVVAKQGLVSMGTVSMDVGLKSYITDICLKDGKLYLADAGARQVRLYSLEGEPLGQITGYEGQGFKVPSPYFSLCAGDEGELWVSDPASLHFVHYDAQDQYMALWQPQEGQGFLGCCNPARLRYLGEGKFVSLEKGQVRARVFSPSGQVESIVAQGSDFALNQSFCYDLALINDPNDPSSTASILILDGHRQQLRFYHQTPQP